MRFLYPKSRQFPFDAVCEQIVRALEARNWKAAGFTVEFRDYGSGAQKLRYVSEIRSDQSAIDLGWHDVKIQFGRPQGRLPGGNWNDVAAVNQVQLARQSLRVYDDLSGPTYDVYVGTDWEQDRSAWWSSPNQRLFNEPRKCVRYSGQERTQGRHAAALAWNEDGREYGPEGEEPRMFRTAEVMEKFRAYLNGVVLTRIVALPVPAKIEEVSAVALPVSMPSNVGPLFTYGDDCDAHRITTGKKNIDNLQPADQYGMSGTGRRLVPTYVKSVPGLPSLAYDGFLWCATAPNAFGEHAPGYGFSDVLVRVTPKDARGIYVADHAAYEKRRKELAAAFKSPRDFTDAEVNDFVCARGCTLVSLLDYKGNYEDPLYLINRELSLDEVEVVEENVSRAQARRA